MKLSMILGIGTLMLSFAATSALAATKAEKQAEVVKSTQSALEKFYKFKPELKTAVANAPGYAMFTTYGVSFIIGGSGGTGLVHDNKTRKDTFMHQAQGSVGLQAGVAENRTLIIFNTAAALHQFTEKGRGAARGGGACRLE